MEFRIADTFTDSLARLTGEEQKAVKTTAFDLQMNPAHPSLQFHRIDRAKDPNFWSIRVSSDIRLIVHKTEGSLLLCYVDHHDKAYAWAERRKLETHPQTGAAQLIEIRETVREIIIPAYVSGPAPAKPLLFDKIPREILLSYGVPLEWMEDVLKADEDTLLILADHLPGEAAEALLELATGTTPVTTQRPVKLADPFAHPDAQRRFRVMHSEEELERALEYPWDKWAVFLHPTQRHLVERDYSGAARVSGTAGTGKTVVALHRAVNLARKTPDVRVLLATFSDTLARALRKKLNLLVSNEPKLAERVEVQAMNAIGIRLYKSNFAQPKIATPNEIKELLVEIAAASADQKFTPTFLLAEWQEVVDAWQLDSWEAYRDVARLGRKTRLPEQQRKQLWDIFEQVRARMKELNLLTHAEIFTRLAAHYADAKSPYEFAVLDEAQDVSIAQLRFLAALTGKQHNGLFMAGDLGQRIFQQPFSWKALGVDVRGRSYTLRINYRTSHQIRTQADRLLGPALSDVDGIEEVRRGTISVFNGPNPLIQKLDDPETEIETVALWLMEKADEGLALEEIGVFVRSENELDRAQKAVEKAGLSFKLLNEAASTSNGSISITTMHLAKGLEFRAVVVMACDDEIIPSQERIESVTEGTDLEEVYNTERHLLYVACTRARDYLLVTSGDVPSEFLDDLIGR